MKNEIKALLDKLNLPVNGRYDNHFYIIDLEDSNEYAKMYTKLDKTTVNTEEPNFARGTGGATAKITNYFEYDLDEDTYNLFLMADFINGKYYLKIGKK